MKSAKETERAPEGNTSLLARKDSFHQWSSDEETNIMMNRMRAFFKNMLATAAAKTTTASSSARPQFVERKPSQVSFKVLPQICVIEEVCENF